MKKIRLVGHSGCTLEVQQGDNGLVVVKTATDPAYGERLKKQHQKQKNFKPGVFLTPLIFDTHQDENGHFGFSMEYISGVTLAEHFGKIPISSIKSIAQKFLSLVPKTHSFDPNAKAVFSAKIKNLKTKLRVIGDKDIAYACGLLQKYEWKHCTSGECHGDMSLENIIWKNGDLYLIDFLDSFYDSWMMDLAKLLFDIESMWSYRNWNSVDTNLQTRLLILKKILVDTISDLKNGQHLVRSIYHMALLHLLRILPYTKDSRTKKYLLVEMNRLCDIIETI